MSAILLYVNKITKISIVIEVSNLNIISKLKVFKINKYVENKSIVSGIILNKIKKNTI